MNKRWARVMPIRPLLFAVSSVLCILVLAFTSMLNIASFNQNYTQSVNNGYAVVTKEVAQKLEYSVKYGKPLDNFFGIESILGQIVKEAPTIQTVSLALPNGTIAYNQHGRVNNQSIPSALLNQLNFHRSTLTGNSLAFRYHGQEYLFLPMYKDQNKLAGMLMLQYNPATIHSTTNHYRHRLLLDLAVLAAIALAAVAAFVFSMPLRDRHGQLKSRTILGFLVTLLAALQVVYGVMNYELFHGAYRALNASSTRLASVVMQHDINSVIEKGVPYNRLYGVNQYLASIESSVPQIGHISIDKTNGQALYSSQPNQTMPTSRSSGDAINVQLAKDTSGQSASLHVVESAKYLAEKSQNLLLDAATVLLTSILFTIEVTLAMLYFVRRRLAKAPVKLQKATREEDEHSNQPGFDHPDFIIRPLTFLMSTAVFMSATFVPLVTKSLYQPLFHLPAHVVIALPNSADSLLGAAATIVAGMAMERFGWKPVFTIGLAVLAGGAILSAISGQELVFILARGIAGAGYGAGLLAVRAFVNRSTSAASRSAALSGMYAGLYGGMNFGSTVGSMLADRLGTTTVFVISSCISIVAIVLTLAMVRNKDTEVTSTNPLVPTASSVGAETAPSPAQRALDSNDRAPAPSMGRFFFNTRVLGFYMLVLLPMAIAGTFLNYFFPLFANASGMSDSTVGRAFLLNGICIVYLGPILSRWLLRFVGVKKSLLLGLFSVVVGMIVFAIHANIFTGFAVIILLGIADGFGLVAQNNYYVGLDASQHIGVSRALGYQGIVRKMGQMVGPLVFGAFAVVNRHIGFAVIGLAMAVLAILFLWNARREPEVYVRG